MHPENPSKVDRWGEFAETVEPEYFDDDGGEVGGIKEDDKKDLPKLFADGLVLVPKKRVGMQMRSGEAKKRRSKALKRQGSVMSAPLTVPPPFRSARTKASKAERIRQSEAEEEEWVS